MMASEQLPLTRTFPSGQIHLAPIGLSRHIKSQNILRHGFEAVQKVKTSQDDARLASDQEKSEHFKVFILKGVILWKPTDE